ncbi:MAG TPA: hypothetical protein PLY93_13680, partial [Turneriella sp.]|nr:hypothetical protein [Turneriella sp.]
MKKILVTSFLLTGLSPLMAASSVEFLQNGFGAKSAGLGNAYGVVVQDPSALYWNPAGLAQIYSEKRITQTVDAVRDGKALADDEEFNKLLEDQNTSGTPDSKTVEITERSTQV